MRQMLLPGACLQTLSSLQQGRCLVMQVLHRANRLFVHQGSDQGLDHAVLNLRWSHKELKVSHLLESGTGGPHHQPLLIPGKKRGVCSHYTCRPATWQIRARLLQSVPCLSQPLTFSASHVFCNLNEVRWQYSHDICCDYMWKRCDIICLYNCHIVPRDCSNLTFQDMLPRYGLYLHRPACELLSGCVVHGCVYTYM